MEQTIQIDWEIRKHLQDLVKWKTQDELKKILSDLELNKSYIEKILVDDGFRILRNGSYIIESNRYFDTSNFEKAWIGIKEVTNLNEAWEVMKRDYLEPYTKNNILPKWHINTIKAKDLYPIINRFLIDNDLRGTNDKVYYNFPICDKFDNNKVFGLVATSKEEKALIEITQDGEYLRHAIHSDEIETYQDFLDKKHI